ncbi:MAG: hypothetical protein M1336_03215 [Deltaproteobacteria bacterium]|nr:hypothetical protein [Deltaproteobacteria bacterium]
MALIEELSQVLARSGFEVRREKLLREVGYRARGGACRLGEKQLVIIDRDQPWGEQLELLAALVRESGHQTCELSQAARRLVEDRLPGA